MKSIPLALAGLALLAPRPSRGQETAKPATVAEHACASGPFDDSDPRDDLDGLLGYDGDPFASYDFRVSDSWPLEWDFTGGGDFDLLGDIDPLEGCCDDGL